MEIRVLRNFLVVAREESVTRAAGLLNISQPALSRQLHALEDELGCQLFRRHSFSIELTEKGRLLRERASDLVEMADKVAGEFAQGAADLGGELGLGLAESWQIRHVARAIAALKKERPNLTFHVTSGDTEIVAERLDRGLIDFAVLAEAPNPEKYRSIALPDKDVWGVVMPESHKLAAKPYITVADLTEESLFSSRQAWDREISAWAGERFGELTLAGTFRLAYNGSVFVREGLGLLLAYDRLVGTTIGSGLAFRPLYPRLEATMYFIWPRRRRLTPAASRLLEIMNSSSQASL